MAANSAASFKIILGSSSVARKHILSEMGYEFEVMTADIDEKSIRREKPEELVMVLAEAKADAIISRLKIEDYKEANAEPTLLITSDISVTQMEGSYPPPFCAHHRDIALDTSQLWEELQES